MVHQEVPQKINQVTIIDTNVEENKGEKSSADVKQPTPDSPPFTIKDVSDKDEQTSRTPLTDEDL